MFISGVPTGRRRRSMKTESQLASFPQILRQRLPKLILDACRRLIYKDLAPRHGFEPRFTAPKAAVLPLDDRGKH